MMGMMGSKCRMEAEEMEMSVAVESMYGTVY